MAANQMSQTGMDGISIPTYLPTYLPTYISDPGQQELHLRWLQRQALREDHCQKVRVASTQSSADHCDVSAGRSSYLVWWWWWWWRWCGWWWWWKWMMTMIMMKVDDDYDGDDDDDKWWWWWWKVKLSAVKYNKASVTIHPSTQGT